MTKLNPGYSRFVVSPSLAASFCDQMQLVAEKLVARVKELPERSKFAKFDEDRWWSITPDLYSFSGAEEYFKQAVINFALVQASHQFEIFLKDFMSCEISRFLGLRATLRIDETSSVDLFSVLGVWGVDISSCTVKDDLEELQLVSNMIKHGYGPSSRKLHERYPHYFNSESFYLGRNVLNKILAALEGDRYPAHNAALDSLGTKEDVVCSGDPRSLIVDQGATIRLIMSTVGVWTHIKKAAEEAALSQMLQDVLPSRPC